MIAARREIDGKEVAWHYDELDQFYRDIWGEHVHSGLWLKGNETRDEAIRQHVAMIATEAGVEPGHAVCDIGCGYGATARMIAAEYGANVTAVTISPAQHAFAVSKPKQAGCRYVLADWLNNDFSGETFERAIAVESSEHMPDLNGFFTQAHRVLKPGGRLVVSAWLSGEQPRGWEKRLLLEPVCREGRMPKMATFSEYQRLAADAGFVTERVRDLTRRIERTWPSQAIAFLRQLAKDPRYARFLFLRHARNRGFALTMLRIWFAYRTGAMRYGVFSFRKN